MLLHMLATLATENSINFSAIHIDHGLSPHSQEWKSHCVDICAQLNVPLVVENVSVRAADKGLEAAAREARYQALASHITSNELLLTAHHRDDQVETVLLQLVRGTGAHGFAGMAEKRQFANGSLIRPLLTVSHDCIANYAGAHELHWVDDESNDDTSFDRNYIRHKIMPMLRVRWAGVDKVIGRSAGHAAAAVEILEQIAAEDRQRCLLDESGGLSLRTCNDLDKARLQNLLRYWVRSSGLAVPTTRHINEMMQQIRTPSATGAAIINWPGAIFYRYRDMLRLSPQGPNIDYEYDINWDLARPVVIPPLGITVSASSVVGQGLAVSRVENASLHLRNRQGGESLLLPGRSHHHKLKKLFQEAGIPPWERKKMPLLYVDGELAAIGDRWVSQEFVAGEDEAGLALKISTL